MMLINYITVINYISLIHLGEIRFIAVAKMKNTPCSSLVCVNSIVEPIIMQYTEYYV